MFRFVVLWCFAIFCAQAQAQTSASLRIATEAAGAEFHQGERIGLVLTFEIRDPGDWLVRINGDDRSMLGLDDRFVVSPAEGVTDPWASRFTGAFAYAGFPGQTLRSPGGALHVDLNQWVRFDRPGYYRVHAIFHLTTLPHPGSVPPGPEVVVESNDIGLNIVAADAEWQAGALQAALTVLKTIPVAPDNKSLEARTIAAREIGYLDTPDSIRESARLLGSSDLNVGYVLRDALLDSVHRDEAIAAMKRLLTAPDEPITPLFQQTLSELEHNRDSDLTGAVARKSGAAKAITLETLIEKTPADAVTPGMRSEIAGLFAELPQARQADLLGGGWNRISGPAMIPVLRHIYDNPPEPPQAPTIQASAVERLYELDPAQGRTLLLEEMRLPSPHLPFSVLSLLPDATLPDFDRIFAEHLERDKTDRELIARYATPAILDRVKAVYAKRDPVYSCESALIAYFLRADPAWGESVFRQTLAERGNPRNGCWMTLTGRTASFSAGPAWEKVAIGALNDPSVAVKIDAVKALAEHGSPASEAAVWEAFRYWHEWWKGRESQLNDENRRFEQVFAQSIARAKNWPITAADFDHIHDLCITDACVSQAAEYGRNRP